MQTDEAILIILKMATTQAASATKEQHMAADVVKGAILALRMGISLTGRQLPDFTMPNFN